MGPKHTESRRDCLSADYSAPANSGNSGNPPEPQSHQSIEGIRDDRRESQNLGTIKVHRQHLYAFFFNHATHGRPSFVSGLGLAAILLRDEHHEKCGQYSNASWRPQPTAFSRGRLFIVIVEYADAASMEMLRDLSNILSLLAGNGQWEVGSVVIH